MSGRGAPFISFLSDYGLQDEFVGVCHGVIARRCPQARVIDLTHAIPRHDVLAGALVLRGALAHLPAGVHLAVVDPEVGAGTRRAIALRTGARATAGGARQRPADARRRSHRAACARPSTSARSPERLEPVSSTFHGRDIFAPVAAALAAGAALEEVGEPVRRRHAGPPARRPQARSDGENLIVHVLLRDGFGNLSLDADARARSTRSGASSSCGPARGPSRAARGGTFADVPAGAPPALPGRARRAPRSPSTWAPPPTLLGAGPGDELAAVPGMSGPAGAGRRLGWPRIHLRATDSTNERARELAVAGAPAGTLVTAGRAERGTGAAGTALVGARREARS